MVLSIVLLSLGAFTLFFFLYEKTKQYSLKATLIKAFTSLVFVSLGVYSWFKNDHQTSFGVFVIIGLVLGLMGDIFLDFKYVFKEEDKLFTYAGFTVFGVGHILYVTGMFVNFYQGSNPLYIILPLVFGILMGFVTIFTEKPFKLKFGNMKWVVFTYASLLFTTLGTAFSLFVLSNFKSVTLLLMTIGGVFFAVSDLILSGTYFGVDKERPVDIISNAVTYYAAQFIIAYSLFFIGVMF